MTMGKVGRCMLREAIACNIKITHDGKITRKKQGKINVIKMTLDKLRRYNIRKAIMCNGILKHDRVKWKSKQKK